MWGEDSSVHKNESLNCKYQKRCGIRFTNKKEHSHIMRAFAWLIWFIGTLTSASMRKTREAQSHHQCKYRTFPFRLELVKFKSNIDSLMIFPPSTFISSDPISIQFKKTSKIPRFNLIYSHTYMINLSSIWQASSAAAHGVGTASRGAINAISPSKPPHKTTTDDTPDFDRTKVRLSHHFTKPKTSFGLINFTPSLSTICDELIWW